MRAMHGFVMGVAVAALISGCKDSQPMKVEAPNEVIFKVPSMT